MEERERESEAIKGRRKAIHYVIHYKFNSSCVYRTHEERKERWRREQESDRE